MDCVIGAVLGCLREVFFSLSVSIMHLLVTGE